MKDADIARVVAQADLPAIASSFTTVRKYGSEFKALCPFHADSNPSLTIYQKNGKWNFKCFACDEAGDALDWIRKLEGLDFAAALERLGGATEWKPRILPESAKPLPSRITSKPPPSSRWATRRS